MCTSTGHQCGQLDLRGCTINIGSYILQLLLKTNEVQMKVLQKNDTNNNIQGRREDNGGDLIPQFFRNSMPQRLG